MNNVEFIEKYNNISEYLVEKQVSYKQKLLNIINSDSVTIHHMYSSVDIIRHDGNITEVDSLAVEFNWLDNDYEDILTIKVDNESGIVILKRTKARLSNNNDIRKPIHTVDVIYDYVFSQELQDNILKKYDYDYVDTEFSVEQLLDRFH